MPGKDRGLLTSFGIFAVALTVYVTFLTAHYSFDSVGGGILLYQWLAHGRIAQLFHRYHILYLGAAAGLEMILKRAGVELDPLTILQLMSAVFAAGSIAVYHRLARALGLGLWLSAIVTALFGGSFCFWFYATTGESYPISIFFLLIAFLSAVRSAPDASWARAVLPGVWLGLAACFHGTCLLAVPGLAVMVAPADRAPGRYRRLLAMMAAVVLVVGAPYAVRSLLRPAGVLATDASRFAAETGWSLMPRPIMEWRSLAHSMAPTDWPMVPSRYPGLARAAGLALLAVTLLPLALLFRFDRARRRPALAVAVWLAVSFVFFSMYFPGSAKFAAYLWAPWLLLVGWAIQHVVRRRGPRLAAVAALGALTAITLFCSFDLIRRQTDPATNLHLARARAIAALTEPDDVVVHLGRGDDQLQNVYIPYFAARRSLSLEQRVGTTSAGRSAQAIEASLASAVASGRVVVAADVLEPGAAGAEFETAHELPDGSLARIFAAHDPRLLARDPAVGSLWLLTR